MGVMVKLSLFIRLLAAVVFTLTMGITAIINRTEPNGDALAVAAVMGAIVLYSNWNELMEQAAHMAHHPKQHPKGGHHHEPAKPGAD